MITLVVHVQRTSPTNNCNLYSSTQMTRWNFTRYSCCWRPSRLVETTVRLCNQIHLNLYNNILSDFDLGFSQKICFDCRSEAMSAYRFRQMCISTDENVRSNRKPLVTNNEHDYSTWNINDYDMDLSEYLIDTKEETIQHSLLPEPEIQQTPAIDETQNFDAPVIKKARRYSCPVCSKLWVTPSKLKRHMSVHRNEKPVKEVQRVDVKKPSFSSLTFFEPLEVKKEPEVQCPICFLAIDSQSKLLLHMTVHIKTSSRIEQPETLPIPTAQKIGKRYICTDCSSESPSPAKLQSHMRSKHMRKAATKQPLEKMMLQNRVNKTRNSCSFCSKSFPNSSSLKRHITVHLHPKKSARRQRTRKHACQYCEKRFETPSKLMRHQTVHRDLLMAIKRHAIEGSPVLEISAVTNILGD